VCGRLFLLARQLGEHVLEIGQVAPLLQHQAIGDN